MKSEDEFERNVRLIASNKKALHDYFITSRLEAGIVLQGTEVKSLREGKCSIKEAYAGFKNKNEHEFFIFNMHIPEYKHGNRENHEPTRDRKLLLTEREIRKLKTQLQEKGLTVVPLEIYFSGHLVKIEIGVAKAKKKYDKRESTKTKEMDREIRRKYKV
jgi:SsrA-binding protein